MKRLRWQILIVVLALIAIGVLLLSQQPVLQTVNPIQPTSGGIYSEALIGSFGRLNPALDYFNPVDHDIDRLLYSGLIKFNDFGLPEGDLVESWGISADGKVYNFSIRSNATWHDGQPVTSDDVIFTTDLLHNDAIPLPDDIKALWKQVEVKALDQKTLQFRLPEPFAPFLDYLSFGVLPKHLLGSTNAADLVNAQFNMQPVGSGPYRFDHLTAENGQITTVVLSAYDKYHFRRPYMDQVVFRYYLDASAALAGYRNEDVLGIGQISEDILGEALKEPALNVYTGRLPDLTLLFLNLNDPKLPFFQDATIRRALLSGLNRQWIVDRLLNGQAVIADGPIFPGTWAYYENIEHVEYDPAKATALIKAGGYTIPAEGGAVRTKEGVALSFELVYPDGPKYSPLAEAVQKDWAKLGVQVNLKPVPFEELLNGYLEPHTYQAALVTLSLAGSPDPDPYPFWDQAQISGGQNYAQWNDRQASEFLEGARVTVDTSERAKLYRNFQVRFSTDLPALPLFYPVYSYGVNDQVKNVRIGSFFDPSDRFNTLPSWYLVVKRPIGVGESLTPTP
jgi:peptide/nickel transport system substrate-binding protein